MVRLALWIYHQCGQYEYPHFRLDLQHSPSSLKETEFVCEIFHMRVQ